jgi:predicted Zn-dependent protease
MKPLLLILCASSAFAADTFEEVAVKAASARERNNDADAVALYRQALQLRPDWKEGWWFLGTSLYSMQKPDESSSALKHLVELDDRASEAWALLGVNEFALSEHKAALDHLQRGISLGVDGNPQISYVARYHAALLLTRFEQFEAASVYLLNLAKEGKQSDPLVVAMGLAALRMPILPDQLPAARRELVIRAGNATFDAHNHRAAEARSQYSKLIQENPSTPNLHYLYGVFLLKSDSDAGLRELRKEIELSPDHLQARLHIAFEYLKRRDSKAGLPYARDAVRLNSRSFAARNALGRLLLDNGELVPAITELETAAMLAPEIKETHYALASAYARAGRKAEAERERAEFKRLEGSPPK